jgi:chromosome segregation ATPase
MIQMKTKEHELVQVICTQKEEYDKLLKERDEEVTAFVEGIVKENRVLKKQIISLEIDLEYYKEVVKNNDLNNNSDCDNKAFAPDSNNNPLDRQFYENLRIIKETNENKQIEILDKYDRILKGLIKETRSQVSSLRRNCLDNKNRVLNGDEGDGVIPLSQVEEQFSVFENRIRLLYEELRNKEKYILVVEQKYEMINEEARFLKRKIFEEKQFLLKQIENVRNEKDLEHENLLKQVKQEIIEKKEGLQIQIDNSLHKNNEFVNLLVNEKNRLKIEIEKQKETIEKLQREKDGLKSELKGVEKMKDNINKESKQLGERRQEKENEFKSLNYEIDMLKKANNDLTEKLNDFIEKNLKLEKLNKQLTENSADYKISEAEKKFKNIIDKLTNENINLEKQIKDSSNNSESDVFKIKTLTQNNEKLTSELETLKIDFNSKNLELKVLNRNIEETLQLYEKTKRQLNSEKEKHENKEEELKDLKEKLMIKETEIKTLRLENDRVLNLKEKHFNQSK